MINTNGLSTKRQSSIAKDWLNVNAAPVAVVVVTIIIDLVLE